ncbi:hypothetical protein KKA14_03710 [bacterium]|nr:hypothetical protein [bacterium]
MDKFIDCFGKDIIQAVTADRESIGAKWLTYLRENEIDICIRTKENIKVTKKNGKTVSRRNYFARYDLARVALAAMSKQWESSAIYPLFVTTQTI